MTHSKEHIILVICGINYCHKGLTPYIIKTKLKNVHRDRSIHIERESKYELPVHCKDIG